MSMLSSTRTTGCSDRAGYCMDNHNSEYVVSSMCRLRPQPIRLIPQTTNQKLLLIGMTPAIHSKETSFASTSSFWLRWHSIDQMSMQQYEWEQYLYCKVCIQSQKLHCGLVWNSVFNGHGTFFYLFFYLTWTIDILYPVAISAISSMVAGCKA